MPVIAYHSSLITHDLSRTAEIPRRDRIGEPDTVLGAVEEVPITMHRGGINREDDRLAVTRADFGGCFHICREVHVMSRHFRDAMSGDGISHSMSRAMK